MSFITQRRDEEKETNQKKQDVTDEDVVMDNPCWGGMKAEQQNLFYFLQRVDEGYFRVPSSSLSAPAANATSTSATTVCSASTNSENHQKIIQSLIFNNIILYNDKDYLVLNKPPDVRMDGPHLMSVHKLVTFLFPPPSILEQMKISTDHVSYDTKTCSAGDLNQNHCQAGTVGRCNSSIIPNPSSPSSPPSFLPSSSSSILPIIHSDYNTRFINRISKLSHHGETKDSIMKNTHQLDYATSGTLLLAKHKHAAASACKAFEIRSTKKEYLALVHGNLNSTILSRSSSSSSSSNIPFLNTYQYETYLNWMNGTIEKIDQKERIHKKGGKKKKFTFEGYMPTHTVFGKWKSIRIRRREDKKIKDHRVKRKRKHEEEGGKVNVEDENNCHINKCKDSDLPCSSVDINTKLQEKILETQLDEEKEVNIWNKNPSSTFTPQDEQALLNQSWKDIKKCKDKTIKTFFESIATDINEFYRMKYQRQLQIEKERHEQEMKDLNKRLPTVFRLHPTTTLENGESQQHHENEFYVQIPIAVAHDDRFQMVVHPDFLSDETLFLPQEIRKRVKSQYSVPKSIAKDLEFKPSLTKCIVKQITTQNGQEVTKVLLQPRTGRR